VGRIRVLPDNVVNRIAAGEVVERPAAVVKELIENALDAGARAVVVRIEDGGRRLVQVLDDGCGMDADDAVAALERHATSKITSETPLEAVATLGFRGEALPSVAAVSRFTLATAEAEGHGTEVAAEGGRILSVRPAPHPKGTTVTVRDLFFNTPARRRFLRAASTETAQVVEAFVGLALSRPDVRFRLEQGGRRLFDLPEAAGLLERLGSIEGEETARRAVRVSAEGGGASVLGFVLGADETSGPRGARRLLVNGRVVRDRLLARAAARALEESLPAGSAAGCVIAVEVPADKVDVNVHPAKAEVRFAEPGLVHDLVRGALLQALGASPPLRSGPEAAGPAPAAWGPGAGRSGDRPGVLEPPAAYAAGSPSAPAATGPGPEAVEEAEPVLPRGTPALLGQYRSGYILAEDEEGLILVDQHAAHERVLFERMSGSASGRPEPIQALLFPRPVSLPAALRGQVEDLAADLASLGFDAEPFGEEALVVRGIPAPLAEADPERLVLEVAAARIDERGSAAGIEGRRRRMLATAACHAAVKVPARLPSEKLLHILEALLECASPLRCPHGRPTLLRWRHRAIERRFGRP
jgi:DNA mismatch repair protein MutL